MTDANNSRLDLKCLMICDRFLTVSDAFCKVFFPLKSAVFRDFGGVFPRPPKSSLFIPAKFPTKFQILKQQP